MRQRTRRLTVTAMMLAVSVVLLYIASLAPTGRIALAAVAGLAVTACVIEGGLGWATACWVCASAIGVFTLPDKGGAIIFLLFFGIYPVMKSIFERVRARWAEWALKIAFFNLVLTGCWAAFRLGFLTEDMLDKWPLWAVYLAGNAVFILYDVGFSRLIALYIARVASKRNQK